MRLGETSIGRAADLSRHEACYAVPSSKSLLMAAAMQRFVRNHNHHVAGAENKTECKERGLGETEQGPHQGEWARKESHEEAGPREALVAPAAGDWPYLLEFFMSMQKSVEAIETNLDLGRKMQQGYFDESFLALLDIVEGLGTDTQVFSSERDSVGLWKTLNQQAERLQRRCSEHYFAR